ncbi:MAG: FecR family protein [Mucilaginibacter sp.]|nr:FecR family protein [Mucilaginibacter sp.]
MNGNNFNPEELAHKWVAGTLTPEEKSRFEEWYADFNDQELLLSSSKYTSADQIGTTILNCINAQLDEQQKPKVKVFTLWRSIVAAAAVILVIGFAVLNRDNLMEIVNPTKQLQFTSNAGQYKQISLPDGTHIWLSPNTTISYPEQFKGKQRNVSITGEAYFEVMHDTNHPFVIQSGAVKTVVLGTSFDIQAHPKAASIEVTVVSGKVGVSVDAIKAPQMLLANQRSVYKKATNTLIKENYPEAAKFLDQRKGIFDFKGTSLQEVIRELETQYCIRINLASGLSAKAFYGRLQTTASIDRTLDKLCAVMETRWEKQGATYLLHL